MMSWKVINNIRKIKEGRDLGSAGGNSHSKQNCQGCPHREGVSEQGGEDPGQRRASAEALAQQHGSRDPGTPRRPRGGGREEEKEVGQRTFGWSGDRLCRPCRPFLVRCGVIGGF